MWMDLFTLRWWLPLSPRRLFPDLTIWVARWVSYKKQELLTLREHLGSPPVFFVGVHVGYLFSFMCCVLCVFVLFLMCPTLPVSLDCPFLIAPSFYPSGYSKSFVSLFSIFLKGIFLHIIINRALLLTQLTLDWTHMFFSSFKFVNKVREFPDGLVPSIIVGILSQSPLKTRVCKFVTGFFCLYRTWMYNVFP